MKQRKLSFTLLSVCDVLLRTSDFENGSNVEKKPVTLYLLNKILKLV